MSEEDWDFRGVLGVIRDGTNPEIWHMRNGTHPGVGWSIKTVIPRPQTAGIDSRGIITGWSMICARYPMSVTWTDDSYDWAGNHLPEWQTMWVRDGFDVVSDEVLDDGTTVYTLIKAEDASERAVAAIIDQLRDQLAASTSEELTQELAELLEVAEAMVTKTSDVESKAKRKRLRVVEDD